MCRDVHVLPSVELAVSKISQAAVVESCNSLHERCFDSTLQLNPPSREVLRFSRRSTEQAIVSGFVVFTIFYFFRSTIPSRHVFWRKNGNLSVGGFSGAQTGAKSISTIGDYES